MKFYRAIYIILTVIICTLMSGCVHSNSGESVSHGSHGDGSLENGYRVKYRNKNSKYFSRISYYIMGNGYVNSKLYYTIIDSYKECETTCPGVYFRMMECSNHKGGKMLMHRTHRNGLSVDFMVPKLKRGKRKKFYDRFGILHYLLNFNEEGKLKLSKKVSIDFNSIAKHIIALDNAAKKNGLYVSKVIFKIDLKDDLFKCEYGNELKKRGIYFAKSLPKIVDDMHDDHYHVDFEIKK